MKNLTKLAFSILGVFIVLVILFAVNFIAGTLNVRLDLTEDSLYSLSSNSKRILSKLDTPVTIRYYFSKSNAQMPIFLKTYARQAEDLLEEYKQAGNGNVIIEKYDPKPDSDAEDSALKDAILGQMLNTGDKIYLGLSISCIDQTETLAFLNPQRENLLEYDITNAITLVVKTKKTVIGVMSALPVMGERPTPMMMQMGQFQGSESWLAIKELQKGFDVRQVMLDTTEIDPEIKLLLIIHPSGISDSAQFAVDQFVLRGGKLVAYVDPNSFVANSMARQKREYAGKTSSSLPKLFQAWGIIYDEKKVVGDMVFGRSIKTRQQMLKYITVLDITKKGFDQNEVISAQLNRMSMVFSGALKGEVAEGLTKIPLIKSTKDSDLLQSNLANQPQRTFKDFNSDETAYDLAVVLTGKFKTAFPGGKPEAKPDPKNPKPTDDAKKTDEKTEYLKESNGTGTVVIVADSDLLFNDFCVRVNNFLGQQMVSLLNDNLRFSQNLVDYMSGDNDLIGIRCRQKISRPFEVIKEMEAKADKKFKDQVVKLEEEVKAAQARLNQLQRQKKDKNQQFILSPEQMSEVKKLRKQETKFRKDLKKQRKELRKDIDSLENLITSANIGLMPLLVVIFGISLWVYRKTRSSAK